MSEINNGAVLSACGFFRVFEDIHQKYFTGKSKVPVTNTAMTGLMADSLPYVVNGAFACELAMKSVISEKDSRKLKHNLKEIYNSDAFDKEYKDAILNSFIATGLSKQDFETVLEESSNLFQDWRYFYEESKTSHAVPKNFYEFVNSCVRAMITFSCFTISDEKTTD